MRKRDIALLLLVGAVVIGIGTLQIMTQIAQQARDANAATIETPAPIRLYQELSVGAAEAVHDEETETLPGVSMAVEPCGSRQAIMAAWIALFEEASQWKDTELRTVDFDSSEVPPLDMLFDEAKSMDDFFERVRALAQCGGPLYPLEFPEFHLYGSPHEAGWNDVTRLLRGGAFVAAEQDDAPKAIANFIAILQMADALAFEPSFFSQELRYDVYDAVREAYLRCYGDAVPSPELLTELSTHLAQAHHREGIYNGLSAQTSYTVELFAYGRAASYSEKVENGGLKFGTMNAIWTSALCRSFYLEDERSAIEFWERIAPLPNAPFYEVKPDLDRIQTEADEIPLMKGYSKLMVSGILQDNFRHQARHEIGVDLWRLKLLAERYRADTGALPASLQEAVDHFGEALPIDPGNGKPYRYMSKEDCYVLSSSGISLVGGEDFSYSLCPE